MKLARGLLLWWLLAGPALGEAVRVMTFNVGDVRASDLQDAEHPRLRALGAIIRTIRPDILLLNEIATDPSRPEAVGERFVAEFLARPQADGLPGLRYRVFAAPSNTGVHAGLDLDRDGQADAGAAGRAFAWDCWGYGEFPGHYGMALLVLEPLAIDRDRARTFRTLRWADMPGAMLPAREPGSDEGWYTPEALAGLPLSSKSHWDVPVRLVSGAEVHVLASHPTPPVFDGPEDRNGRRNHDEIRLWGEYLSGAAWIVDDAGNVAPFPPQAHGVIVGDLNADPIDGDSLNNPVGRWLLAHPRLAPDVRPRSATPIPGLDPTDTSRFRLRVDYVLPTAGLRVLGSGVWRSSADNPPGVTHIPALPPAFPSDHFPVWVDLDVPDPAPAR